MNRVGHLNIELRVNVQVFYESRLIFTNVYNVQIQFPIVQK